MLTLIFCLFLLFLLTYEPIIGYFSYQKLKKDLKEHQEALMKYYRQTLWGLWIPTIFILLFVGFADVTFKDIGLTLPTWQPDILGFWISIVFVSIGAFYLVVIVSLIATFYTDGVYKEKFLKEKEEAKEKMTYRELLPVTQEEKKMWGFISITAGVTEEIIYRGFLIYTLTFLFPSLSIWLVMLVASVLFGLAHSYQGLLSGVVRTTVVGFLFCGIYVALGSILPLIILHFCIDYIAKLGE